MKIPGKGPNREARLNRSRMTGHMSRTPAADIHPLGGALIGTHADNLRHTHVRANFLNFLQWDPRVRDLFSDWSTRTRLAARAAAVANAHRQVLRRLWRRTAMSQRRSIREPARMPSNITRCESSARTIHSDSTGSAPGTGHGWCPDPLRSTNAVTGRRGRRGPESARGSRLPVAPWCGHSRRRTQRGSRGRAPRIPRPRCLGLSAR